MPESIEEEEKSCNCYKGVFYLQYLGLSRVSYL